MSANSLSLAGQSSGGGLRLNPTAVAVPALASHVRPALVLHEREARTLLETASRYDVSSGGCFSAGPAGIQVWTGPWDGPNGGHGGSVHLGSVDWSYDTPVRHYATVYRAMVTEAGVNCGETTTSVLARVLALSGLPLEGSRVTMPQPPRRDPFRGHRLPDRPA
ncbi:MAG: hypothetical protein QOE76_4224 [Frankiales bacterium]|nr:hypothetical protein [Frankiales bacterium]